MKYTIESGIVVLLLCICAIMTHGQTSQPADLREIRYIPCGPGNDCGTGSGRFGMDEFGIWQRLCPTTQPVSDASFDCGALRLDPDLRDAVIRADWLAYQQQRDRNKKPPGFIGKWPTRHLIVTLGPTSMEGP